MIVAVVRGHENSVTLVEARLIPLASALISLLHHRPKVRTENLDLLLVWLGHVLG